jgi:hypothetical protein
MESRSSVYFVGVYASACPSPTAHFFVLLLVIEFVFFRGRFGGEVPGGEFRKSKEAGHYSGLFNNNR